jgi:hypothetical protein
MEITVGKVFEPFFHKFSFFQDIGRTARSLGIYGLYRGFWFNLLAGMPASAVAFSVYETTKGILSEISRYHCFLYSNIPIFYSETYTLNQAASGGLAGLSAALVTAPFDVLKTKMQVHAITLLDAAKQTIKDGGLKAFWTGVAPRLMILIPINALNFVMFETAKDLATIKK